MNGDNDAAVEFLRSWPARPIVISAVDPERKQGMLTYQCATPNDVRQILGQWNGKRNLYFTVNNADGFVKDDKVLKPKKEHIKRMVAVHVDVDPGKDKDIPSEQARILKALQDYKPKPSVITFSGGGYQGFWLLRQSIEVTNADELEAHNRRPEKDMGGDHCFNIDRIMRLPGTVNLPDKKKRDKGRTEQVAYVVEADWSLLYELDDIKPWSEPAQGAKARGRPKKEKDVAWLERILKNGPDKEGKHSYGGDRSRATWAVACAMARRNWPLEKMVAALLDRDNRLSDHVYDQSNPEKYAERQAQKAIDETFQGLSVDDFYSYMPRHSYIYTPTLEMWPATSVNVSVGKVAVFNEDGTPRMAEEGEQELWAAARWLDHFKPVHQMTWAPGEPQIIRDRHIAEGGWFDKAGAACFNQYRPPLELNGDADKAQKWIDHVMYVYPNEGGHLLRYFAQRVQHPEIKPNHALVLGGSPGIGKDTLLEPVKHSVGPWNFADITPQNLLGRFNGFVKSVLLRISEARDLEVSRYQFYEHIKIYTASPPDVIRVDEKHLQEYSITNCFGVIITTNYKTDGIYLPADDRRHYVAWSDKTKDDFTEGYWRDLWRWYEAGGYAHVAAYLKAADIGDFDPKEPPPKTDAFLAIVDANRSPEDNELEQVLEDMNMPKAVTLDTVSFKANDDFRSWLKDRKNRRAIPHRFEKCGYGPVRNPNTKDGLWRVGGKKQVIYAQVGLVTGDQYAAAAALDRGGENKFAGRQADFDIPL
jgi:hypothetical protein